MMPEKPPDPKPDLQKLVDLVARLRAPTAAPGTASRPCPTCGPTSWKKRTSWPEPSTAATGKSWAKSWATCSSRSRSSAVSARNLVPSASHRSSMASTARWWSATRTSSATRCWPTPRPCARPGSGASLQKEPKRESLFSGVPASLPALLGAYRLTQKAAGVGFDWPDAGEVLDKADEEIAELRASPGPGGQGRGARRGGRPPVHRRQPRPQAGRRPRSRPRRHQPQVPAALRKIEQGLAAQGKTAAEATLEEMDALWEAAKGEPAP